VPAFPSRQVLFCKEKEWIAMTDINQIENIFRDALELMESDEISDDLPMDQIPAWDSLAQMTIIIQLKKKFDINFLFDEILSMNTLGKIKKITTKKISEREN